VLAYRIAEPESFLDGPIADTLEFAHHNGPRLTARASEAVPGGCRIPIAAGLRGVACRRLQDAAGIRRDTGSPITTSRAWRAL